MFTSRTLLSSHALRFARRSLAVAPLSVFAKLETTPSTSRICASACVCVLVAAAVVNVQESASSSTYLEEEHSQTTLLNWSGTHAVQVSNDRYWEPESVAEVEEIVRACHGRGQSVRPLGSALSPNGIAFNEAGMISMANLDQVVAVDTVANTVTVQAGARVSQVVDALRPYRMTLPNLASIAEQQMGGFVQVGAHGTGRCIAPVDHYVTNIKLVTPSRGTLTLTEDDGELFHMAKVGLGCLGVVVEVTMKCIPAHYLREHTFVLTRQEAKEQLDTLLKEHKHMRYMWIPYTDAVVCVTNDPHERGFFRIPQRRKLSDEERFRPLTDLLIQVTTKASEPFSQHSVKGMGFGEIRDALLAVDPLNVDHVKRCNEAEAEFWRKSEGFTVKPSDELLQFDCGGQVRDSSSSSFVPNDVVRLPISVYCCIIIN
jgi:L-galactono-1,4-lactone dehydrogenase